MKPMTTLGGTLNKTRAAILAMLLGFVMIVSSVLGAQSAVAKAGSNDPTPYQVSASGITLPAGSTFQDNGHINVRLVGGGTYNIHFEGKCKTKSDAECAGDKHRWAQYIGKNSIPWSAFPLPASYCVEWVQLSQYNEHYGEGGQPPVGPGCSTPNPTPTATVTVTPPPPTHTVTETVTPNPVKVTETVTAPPATETVKVTETPVVTVTETATAPPVTATAAVTETPTTTVTETVTDSPVVETETVHATETVTATATATSTVTEHTTENVTKTVRDNEVVYDWDTLPNTGLAKVFLGMFICGVLLVVLAGLLAYRNRTISPRHKK